MIFFEEVVIFLIMEDNLIHQIEEKKETISYQLFFSLVAITVILGIFFGYGISQIKTNQTTQINNKKIINSEKKIGVVDKSTFKDSAEGVLKEGGIDGEGNFHLEREGGPSQNVYLTSSTVDLSQFLGKKIKVWGQTFKSQKAGWLMDVGLVEIIK